jgi:predicted Zn-dependent peptidase
MSGANPTRSAPTPELVWSFHHDHFQSTGATLVMAGDFPDDPFQVAEAALGSWQGPSRPSPEQPTPGPADQQLILIDRPGAVQADLRLGGYGIDRRDPRWADITVASYAVGGAFLSRLNAVLREEKGYTYGVRMQFSPLRSVGSFTVQGSFRTEVVVDALVEARRRST